MLAEGLSAIRHRWALLPPAGVILIGTMFELTRVNTFYGYINKFAGWFNGTAYQEEITAFSKA